MTFSEVAFGLRAGAHSCHSGHVTDAYVHVTQIESQNPWLHRWNHFLGHSEREAPSAILSGKWSAECLPSCSEVSGYHLLCACECRVLPHQRYLFQIWFQHTCWHILQACILYMYVLSQELVSQNGPKTRIRRQISLDNLQQCHGILGFSMEFHR